MDAVSMRDLPRDPLPTAELISRRGQLPVVDGVAMRREIDQFIDSRIA